MFLSEFNKKRKVSKLKLNFIFFNEGSKIFTFGFADFIKDLSPKRPL